MDEKGRGVATDKLKDDKTTVIRGCGDKRRRENPFKEGDSGPYLRGIPTTPDFGYSCFMRRLVLDQSINFYFCYCN